MAHPQGQQPANGSGPQATAEGSGERTPAQVLQAAVFWLFRLNRTAMVAAITGASACAAGAGPTRSLWMALGTFSLGFSAGRDPGVEGPRADMHHSPLTDGPWACVPPLRPGGCAARVPSG